MNKSISRLHQFCACTGYSVNRYRPDSVLYIFQRTLMCDSVLSVIDFNRLDSVLCSDQCTLQYCFRLLNSILKIFSCTHG